MPVVFYCPQPRSDRWRIPAQRGGFHAVLGWAAAMNQKALESGVPPPVARIFSQALTELGWVAFANSSRGGELRNQSAATTMTLGILRRVRERLTPPAPRILVTGNPDTVAEAFDDSGCPWWMQGQLLLVGRDRNRLSRLNWKFVRRLMAPLQPFDFRALSEYSVDLVMAPGVDGDVAGIICSDPSTVSAFEAITAAAATRSGFDFQKVTESELSECLAAKKVLP